MSQIQQYHMRVQQVSALAKGNPVDQDTTACNCGETKFKDAHLKNIQEGLRLVVAEGRGLPLQTLLKQMSAKGAQASRMSVDTGPFSFHYIIEGAVCYLTLTGCQSPPFPFLPLSLLPFHEECKIAGHSSACVCNWRHAEERAVKGVFRHVDCCLPV